MLNYLLKIAYYFCKIISLYLYISRCVETVIGKTNLIQKNITSDLIYVEVLIQANIASDVARNFQHRR